MRELACRKRNPLPRPIFLTQVFISASIASHTAVFEGLLFPLWEGGEIYGSPLKTIVWEASYFNCEEKIKSEA